MTIKQFLMIIFIILLAISLFLRFKSYEIEKALKVDNLIRSYQIIEFDCKSGIRTSSSIIIYFKGKKYKISTPKDLCREFKKGNKKVSFYYFEEKDSIYIEGYNLLFCMYSNLTLVSSMILPLLGGIIYRKELSNNYKTM